MQSFKQFFTEAPVDEIMTIGSGWTDPKQKEKKQKYDAPSIALLTNDKYLQKAKAEIAKDLDYNFSFYFAKSKKAQQHREYGIISVETLKTLIPDVDFSVIEQNPNMENTINIVFTNNVGDDKVPLTPWMICHRIGHVLYRSRLRNVEFNKKWDYFEKDLNRNLRDYYNVDFSYFNDPEKRKSLRRVLHKLGTFRSARMNRITRPYEFIFECFAQYMMTGSINFNPVPDKFVAEEVGNQMQYHFDDILSMAVGKIFLM